MGMIYNKRPTDITTQLAMLKQRGLIVNDDDNALKQLASISYFRLASYWKIFETDETTHQFASGTRLEDVISLYNFDKELRSIIFTAIQDIEVALRTRIIHFFSMAHGAFWFMEASKFNSRSVAVGVTFRFGKMELEQMARQGGEDAPSAPQGMGGM